MVISGETCCKVTKLNDPIKKEDAVSKKQHTVLAMALTAILAILAVSLISFSVLSLYIQNPVQFGLSDWLKAVLPISGGAIVVVFAFLGVNRLKDFDERQDKLAKEIRDELAYRMDKSDRSFAESKSSADEYFRNLREDIATNILPNQVDQSIGEKTALLQATFNEKAVLNNALHNVVDSSGHNDKAG